MANYYCLIAGLPDIDLADAQPGYPMEEFVEQLHDSLSFLDARLMANYFFLQRDCQNLVGFLKNPEAELKYEGSYTKEQFTDLVKSATEMNFNVHRDWASLELSPSVESCGCGLGPSPVRLG